MAMGTNQGLSQRIAAEEAVVGNQLVDKAVQEWEVCHGAILAVINVVVVWSLSAGLSVSKPLRQSPQLTQSSKLFSSLKVDNYGSAGKMRQTRNFPFSSRDSL